MKRAGQARVEYLWDYVGAAPAAVPSIPSAVPTEPPTARPHFVACASADWGCKSIRLKEEMTEEQVVNAMEYRPNKVEMKTCGGRTEHPWSCKLFTFGDLFSNIMVYFHNVDDLWVVNSWDVYP
jgi:hypothetical protein